MHFNINIEAGTDQIKLRNESGLIKFFTEGENLEKLLDDFFASFSFPQNALQRKVFLDKKSSELTYHSSFGDPSCYFY